MADEAVSPYKSVPQSMIDNVMSICPDVDRKDVAKDLVITGSATRTINRILDGQVSEHTDFVLRKLIPHVSCYVTARGRGSK